MVTCSVRGSLGSLIALVVSGEWQKPGGPAVVTGSKLCIGK